MSIRQLLTDAYGRIPGIVHAAAEGLDADALAYRPDPDANSIAWLVWHLTRVQDDHVSDIAGDEQAWIAAGWHERFGMAADPHDTGYGYTSDQVGTLRPDGPEILLGYFDAVHERTLAYLERVTSEELARVIDRSWDPPVTVGVRLVSVLCDDLQHAGQARYLRGIVDRL